jgi:hypothetical protein
MWDRLSSAASLATKPSYLPLLDPRRLLRLRRRARGRRRELRLPGITLAGSEDLPRDLQDLRPGAAQPERRRRLCASDVAQACRSEKRLLHRGHTVGSQSKIWSKS